MRNRALQLMNANIIIKMGFFIKDLHRHIEHLHNEQYSNHRDDKVFLVYRGQVMFKTEFEQMKKIKCGLMSFNNFFIY
jgi:hypothetical protein